MAAQDSKILNYLQTTKSTFPIAESGLNGISSRPLCLIEP